MEEDLKVRDNQTTLFPFRRHAKNSPINEQAHLEYLCALSTECWEVAEYQIWRFFGKGRANANPRCHRLQRACLQ